MVFCTLLRSRSSMLYSTSNHVMFYNSALSVVYLLCMPSAIGVPNKSTTQSFIDNRVLTIVHLWAVCFNYVLIIVHL